MQSTSFNFKFCQIQRSIFIIVALVFSLSTQAQTVVDSNYSYYKQNLKFDFTKEENAKAAMQIVDLRTKPLVVRLKTNKRQINAYREAGKIDLANKIEARSERTNLFIISACIKFFNFCPLYFMDMDDKAKLVQSDTLIFSHLLFEKDTAIALHHDSLYYLDFGALFGRAPSNEWSYKDYGKTVEGSSIIEEAAFVIRNSSDLQLTLPLPFYAAVNFSGSSKKSKDRLDYLNQYIVLDNVNSNSVIQKEFNRINEYDAAISKLNSRMYYYFSKVTATPKWAENPRLWLENNPNKYLYPLWITIEKKLLCIQDKTGAQFTKTN